MITNKWWQQMIFNTISRAWIQHCKFLEFATVALWWGRSLTSTFDFIIFKIKIYIEHQKCVGDQSIRGVGPSLPALD
jgi:hypothetical protein